jgi:hypothetical protein
MAKRPELLASVTQACLVAAAKCHQVDSSSWTAAARTAEPRCTVCCDRCCFGGQCRAENVVEETSAGQTRTSTLGVLRLSWLDACGKSDGYNLHT